MAHGCAGCKVKWPRGRAREPDARAVLTSAGLVRQLYVCQAGRIAALPLRGVERIGITNRRGLERWWRECAVKQAWLRMSTGDGDGAGRGKVPVGLV